MGTMYCADYIRTKVKAVEVERRTAKFIWITMPPSWANGPNGYADRKAIRSSDCSYHDTFKQAKDAVIDYCENNLRYKRKAVEIAISKLDLARKIKEGGE